MYKRRWGQGSGIETDGVMWSFTRESSYCVCVELGGDGGMEALWRAATVSVWSWGGGWWYGGTMGSSYCVCVELCEGPGGWWYGGTIGSSYCMESKR